MKKKIYILSYLLILFIIIIYFWWNQAIKPIDQKNNNSISFTIEKGETARIIADRLYKKGLIRSPVAFFIYARFGNLGNLLQAGNFQLYPSQNMISIAQSLTRGTKDIWIKIIEGWRNEEIALELAKKLSIPEAEFLKLAKEGYMFPDSYLVPQDASLTTILNIFTNNFNQKITPELIEKAKMKNLSVYELIIIASLVEREGKHNQDRPIISSIIQNRLKLGMKLDIDSTIQYILGYQEQEKSWWKKELTLEDLNRDSPFNTYKNAGLPPAPIANPGIEAIMAVVNAPDTDYLYYISDSQDNIHPAKTIQEHNANIAKYLNQ